MKRLIFLIIIIGIYACHSNSHFADYRNDPFQFPYPEYYLQSKEIRLSQSPIIPDQVSIGFENRQITFDMDKDISIQIKKKYDSYYLWSGEELLGVLNIEKEVYMGCSGNTRLNQKDFCEAFKSSKEYYLKLYTLTPDVLNKDQPISIGDKWIIHNKGTWFKNVNQIMIYHFSEGIAFRRDFDSKSSQKMKTELIIFHENINPNFIGIGLTTIDNKVIENIVATLKVYIEQEK